MLSLKFGLDNKDALISKLQDFLVSLDVNEFFGFDEHIMMRLDVYEFSSRNLSW